MNILFLVFRRIIIIFFILRLLQHVRGSYQCLTFWTTLSVFLRCQNCRLNDFLLPQKYLLLQYWFSFGNLLKNDSENYSPDRQFQPEDKFRSIFLPKTALDGCCVKSVQIRNFFWSVFSCIRTEYSKIRTRKNSTFGHFSRSVIILNPAQNSHQLKWQQQLMWS